MIMKIRKKILFNLMKIKILTQRTILIMNIQMSLMTVVTIRNLKTFQRKMKRIVLMKILIISLDSFIKTLKKNNKNYNIVKTNKIFLFDFILI